VPLQHSVKRHFNLGIYNNNNNNNYHRSGTLYTCILVTRVVSPEISVSLTVSPENFRKFPEIYSNLSGKFPEIFIFRKFSEIFTKNTV